MPTSLSTNTADCGCFFCRPLADRNPDELVWKHLKADTVGRIAITDKADFKVKVRASMRQLQNNQKNSVLIIKNHRSNMPPESYLRFSHAISFERLWRLMSDLLGLEISEGALVNILDNSRSAFARQKSLIRARLLASSILQSDKSSVRIGKRNWWAWVFHHGDDCCFVIRPNRAKDVVEEFLGEARPDFWVSDRYGAQLG